MTRLKNWGKLLFTITVLIVLSVLMFMNKTINVQEIQDKYGADFHYNAISTSAIIGGFLFTGISILISALTNERIKRLWDNNYLDNLYRAAFLGMISNIITIASAFAVLTLDLPANILQYAIYIEISTIIIGVVFFVWCIRFLIFIITRLKSKV